MLVRQYIKEECSASVFHESGYLLLSQRAEKMHRDAVRDWLANMTAKFYIQTTKQEKMDAVNLL